MTKDEVIYAFDLLGVSLPSNGETDFLNLEFINHLVFSKKEMIFPRFADVKIKIDTKNELIKVYHLKNGDFIRYEENGEVCVDVYDLSELVLIASNTKVKLEPIAGETPQMVEEE